MKPTKEEISLCKQVAEKKRKEIKRGDWYNDLNVGDGNLDLCDRNAGFYYGYLNQNEKIIPLWTISDCLEFLRENYKKVSYAWRMIIAGCVMNILLGQKTINDLHIACLKAVLAVLEEEK